MAELRFLPDLDALVAPLSGDPPGGDKGVFRQLAPKVDELRQEVNPDLYDDKDPQRPAEFRPADWAGVLRLCLPALAERAKDLRIARWVVDALPRREEAERARQGGGDPAAAFAALADGLTLLHRLAADGWDYALPELDPDDPESRNGPFDWLGDDNAGAALPQFVRVLPVAVTPAGPLTQFAWAAGREDERAAAKRAADAADPDQLAGVVAELVRGRDELGGLRQVLAAKLGGAAPAMLGLKNALDECHSLAAGLLPEKTDDGGGGGDDKPGHPTPRPTAGGNGPVASREDAYRALRDAAGVLRRLEPHSPVPYLVLRAVELGGKPFPEMIKSFVRDDSLMAELRRELAIPDDPPAE